MERTESLEYTRAFYDALAVFQKAYTAATTKPVPWWARRPDWNRLELLLFAAALIGGGILLGWLIP